MTRENKLALVVGFGLLLLVGILVSDHFSPARVEVAGDLRAGSDPGIAGQTSKWEPLASATGRDGDEAEIPGVPSDTAPPADDPGSPESADGPLTDPEGLQPGDVHIVVRGDTLEGIAVAHYGDRRLVDALARANGIRDAATIRLGQEILLPPLAVLRGGGTIAGATPDRDASRRMPEREPPVARTYTVQDNDTLSEIAASQMGTARAWRTLLQANRDILRSERDLRAGQVLRIPPIS